MSFITSYIFRAEISKTALLDFITKTPPEYYYFLVPSGPFVYGFFLTNDVVEYFTNEFPVKSLEIIPKEEIKKIVNTPGCKIWGNRELLNF
jgi:hypothetical protein